MITANLVSLHLFVSLYLSSDVDFGMFITDATMAIANQNDSSEQKQALYKRCDSERARVYILPLAFACVHASICILRLTFSTCNKA